MCFDVIFKRYMDKIKKEFEIVVNYYFPRIAKECMCNDEDRYTCRSCCRTFKRVYPVPETLDLNQINSDGQICLGNSKSHHEFFHNLGASEESVASVHIVKKVLSIKDQLVMIMDSQKAD